MHKKIQAMYFLQPGIQSIKIKARNAKMTTREGKNMVL